MLRKDREITDSEEMSRVLDTCKVLRLGMYDEEGIYILPANFGYAYEGEQLIFYLHSGLKGKKLDLLKKCGRVGFEMDCDHELVEGSVPCQYGFRFGSIIGKGTAEVVEDPQEEIKGLTILMECQTGKAFTFNEKQTAIVTVVKVTVTEYTGKRRG